MFGKTLPRSEKLRAVGVFSGIALASAAAFDVMLFSGFQIDPPETQAQRTQPANQDYVTMMDAGWRSNYTASEVSWTEPQPIDTEAQNLDGEAGGSASNHRDAEFIVPTEDELYQEIATLYVEQDRRPEERRQEQAEQDMAADEEKAAAYEDDFSAYETE